MPRPCLKVVEEERELPTLVVVTRTHAGIVYPCGCHVRQHLSFREAYVCCKHAHWRIEADLIRYA